MPLRQFVVPSTLSSSSSTLAAPNLYWSDFLENHVFEMAMDIERTYVPGFWSVKGLGIETVLIDILASARDGGVTRGAIRGWGKEQLMRIRS